MRPVTPSLGRPFSGKVRIDCAEQISHRARSICAIALLNAINQCLTEGFTMPQTPATHRMNLGHRALAKTIFGGGFLGALFASSAEAQLPPLPALPNYGQQVQTQQPLVPQAALGASSRLQTYNVPSDYVGTVGAQLQIQYHDQPAVKVTTDPKTGQLIILAPDNVHQQIGAQISAYMQQNNIQPGDRGMNVASKREQSYTLQHLSWRELEDAIQRLAGPKLAVTSERNGELAVFRIRNASGMEDVMQIDRRLNQITMLGSGPSVAGWSQVVYSLDQGQADTRNTTHVIPVAPAEPRSVRRAIQLVRATLQDANQQAEAQVQVGDDAPASAVGTLDDLSSESGLFGDVQIEFVDDIGLVIIRGSKRDVQRVLEVIEKIKKSAEETQPLVEVYPLQNANAQAVADLVTELYTNIFEPRQGTVSITALGQPNALLLIGRDEVVESVKQLVAKIDQPLDPANQLKVIHLLNASATDVEARIREFFVEKPGGNEEDRVALGTRVKILGDYRTNSLIIQAAPREMVEVEKLIEELDVEGTEAENEVKVFRLKNTLSDDLATVIQEVITGQAQAQGGGQQNTTSATPPSGKLTIAMLDGGKKIESGILAGVVITSDPSVNALVVRAPSQSMGLIQQLIDQLDQLPSAEARIKVFQLQNGDATSLAQTLQSLFGLAVTAGQGAGNNFLTSLAQNQSALTTGGESSLVQLTIAADARTNSIIVSGGSSDLEVFEVLLLRLDEDVRDARRVEVIWLRNANALAVATALSDYFQQQTTANSQLNNGINQILSASQLVSRQVFVVAEEETNSILISATPQYFQMAVELIERLDRRPPLVSVQFLIAEVQLDDGFELGAEWGIQDGLLFDRGSATGGSLSSPVFALGNTLTGPSGTIGQTQNVAGQALSSFGVGRSNASGTGGLVLSASSEAIGVLVRALQTSNRIQVLSRPQITTLDSREAQSLVGSLVPRVVSVSQATGLTPQQVQTTDAQVGLSVAVLPRVNQDGLILLQVRIENSSVGDTNSGIPIGFGANGEVIRSPIITSTNALTTVSAYSGQTVVFAGLISKQRTSNRTQVPILGSLPLIGAAFRFDVETEQRRELMVVMTPRIIQTDEDYETLKQVESSRMSWCLADVLNVHGDVGLSGGNGLWGPARSAVIYPDIQPTVLEDRTRPHAQGSQPMMQPEYFDGGIPLGVGSVESGMIGEPVLEPQLDSSAAKRTGSPFRTVSFPQQSQQPVATGGQGPVQQGAYK
jgi:general secretion pathway protein D